MKNNSGFTMIELLMVIMLVAILGAVALPQFLDFRNEGRVAAAQALQNSLNVGVKLQKSQIILRCGAASDTTIPLDTFAANDITGGSSPPCTTTQIPNTSERRFIDSDSFPANPYNGLTSVNSCAGNTFHGYCYNVSTGNVTVSSATTDTYTCSSCDQSYLGSGGGSTNQTCSGSGCIQDCLTSGGGSCTYACPDGYCQQSCLTSGGGTCNLSCDGGYCSQSANPATSVTCTGGGCT